MGRRAPVGCRFPCPEFSNPADYLFMRILNDTGFPSPPPHPQTPARADSDDPCAQPCAAGSPCASCCRHRPSPRPHPRGSSFPAPPPPAPASAAALADRIPGALPRGNAGSDSRGGIDLRLRAARGWRLRQQRRAQGKRGQAGKLFDPQLIGPFFEHLAEFRGIRTSYPDDLPISGLAG